MTIPDISTDRLVYAIGITARKLQWLDERKIVTARHQGHRRYWGALGAMETAVVVALRAKGLTLPTVRKLLPKMRHDLKSCLGDVAAGKTVYVAGNVKGRATIVGEGNFEMLDEIAKYDSGFVVVKIGPELRRAWFPHTAPTTRRHQ